MSATVTLIESGGGTTTAYEGTQSVTLFATLPVFISDIVAGAGIGVDITDGVAEISATGQYGVSAVNGLTGALSVLGGVGIDVESAGSSITISASAVPNSVMAGPLVTTISAGAGISVSGGGVGPATITAAVQQLIAGGGISLSPVGGTGAVTITASGGGGGTAGVTSLNSLTGPLVIEGGLNAGISVTTFEDFILVSATQVPNSALSGPLVTTIAAGSGIAVSEGGVGPATLSVSAAPNSGLAGPLVTTIAAGIGIAVAGGGVGAATISANNVPNSVLAGPVVTSIVAGNGVTVNTSGGVASATISIVTPVTSLNNLTGAVTIAAGTGISVSTTGATLTVNTHAVPNSVLQGPVVENIVAGGPGIAVTQLFAPGIATISVPQIYVTVTPNGPTDGGNFGPNTPSTQTDGIQEAMNAIASGGRVYVVSGTYTASTWIRFTGSNQTLEFGTGSYLNFVSSISGALVTPAIFGGVGYYPEQSGRLIHMGCDATLTVPTVYTHQRLIGNGSTINFGWQPKYSGSDISGIIVHIPGANSNPPYVGIGGYSYEVAGFTLNGLVLQYLACKSENYGASGQNLSTSEISRGCWFHDIGIVAPPQFDVSGSAMMIRSFQNSTFERINVDCSNVSSGNVTYDALNISGYEGECAFNRFENVWVIANGQSGQCLEIQGCNGLTGNVNNTDGAHDLYFLNCCFDSRASSPVGAKNGGGFLDDNDNDTDTGAHAQVYDLNFENCIWNNVILSVFNKTMFGSVGAASPSYIYNLPTQPGPHAGVLTACDGRMAIGVNVTGGGAGLSTINVIGTGGGTHTTGQTTGWFWLQPGEGLQFTFNPANPPVLFWNAFGYIRFTGDVPQFSAGMNCRYLCPPLYTGVGSSPFTFQNTSGCPIDLFISGGTGVSIQLYGGPTGFNVGTTGVFTIGPGQEVTITYSTQPTLQVLPHGS